MSFLHIRPVFNYFRGVKFGIVIKYERLNLRLQVERLSVTSRVEQYRVTARNQSFVLENNRPLFLNKGLKHRPCSWKVVEGGYDRKPILDLITKEIEKHGFAG